MPYSLSPRKIFCEVVSAIVVYGFSMFRLFLKYKTIKNSVSMYRAEPLFLQIYVQILAFCGFVEVALARIESFEAGVEHRQQLFVAN